ncbi:MAG: hypothetical protein KKF89_05520 [Nanoarchaeota archaeon]|nr:hypothetical protein [Nanoarchaeota archaeon]
MVLNSTNILIYVIGILPALFYALYKENRFVQKNAVMIYGAQTIAFTITSFILYPNVSQNILLFIGIMGLIWILCGKQLQKSAHVLWSFKTLAAIQIPIVLHLNQFVYWKDVGNVLYISIVVLMGLFHWISFKSRK